ncbi:MAG: hypothetical protein NDI90_11765 [Nitrospira sp. BO4]|jgi:hypothetical protein|nr:hypothetical protein [Nitrospira sp. BO4]
MANFIAHPEVYDHNAVVLMGLVKGVQLVTGRKGRRSFKFRLADGVGALKVISRTRVHDGDRIIVEGMFTRPGKEGRFIVYNEVTARSIRPLNQLHSDLVG